jgi:8-oxo-dGTP diphosphatase
MTKSRSAAQELECFWTVVKKNLISGSHGDPIQRRVVAIMHRSKDERVDFFLACRLGSEEPQNREPERCSQLVWARLSSLRMTRPPCVRTAIENFQNTIWFQEVGWEKGTT